MASADNFADGGVHNLTMGSNELNTILSGAARRNQLVLVDFSASWCGPCRMMLPVLHQLAGEHRGRLAVIKVDCEQTDANKALAASSGIRGFPTFHLYRSQRKVAEKVGADQAGLRRAIQEQLAQMGPAGGGGSGASGSGPGPMAVSLATALGRVKQGCTFAEFVAAAKTLVLFVSNVVDHPGEEKYRRVKLSNPAFHSKLGCRAGGKECMAALGFREMMEAGEPVLLLSEVPEELPRVRAFLQQALQSAEAAAAAAAAAERRVASVPPQAPAGAAPPATAAPVAASATVGASGAPAGGAAGSVDASVLAAALATALSTGAGGAGPSAGSAAGSGGAARPARVGPRVINVSPKGMARMLAKALAQAGIGAVPAGEQQQQQAEQAPAPDQ